MNMSMFTIQCRLCTNEETRRYFWELMEKHTILVNELLEKIAQHPQFPEWQKQGNISRQAVREILKPLKKIPEYEGLPQRFYTSAELISCDTYKSWLALQQERKFKLIGKKRWLQAVESEIGLLTTTNFHPDEILAQAGEIREKAIQRQGLNGQGSKLKSLMGILLDMHDQTTESPLSRRAINHLLINKLQISKKTQNLQEFCERLDKKRVEIERIEEQLNSRLPKGRDPTGQRYLQLLIQITAVPEWSDDPQKLEAELEQLTQQQQLPLFKELPYPIRFDSAGDLYWSQQTQDTPNSANSEPEHQELAKAKKSSKCPKQRIGVRFKGVEADIFKIQCDRRQLPLFQRFLDEYQTHKKLPEAERFSEGLFTLRSAHLIWDQDDKRPHIHQKRKSKNIAIDQQQDPPKPWNTHRLYLHCTVGRPLLTAEGTEQVKAAKKKKIIAELKGKEKLEESQLQELGLNQNQIADVKRKCSTLNRLEHNSPPPRPSIKPYEGQSHIVIGVSFSRHEPVTIAVVDVEKQQVLECQSTKELLNRGKAQSIWRNGKKELLSTDGVERRHPNGGKLYIRKGKHVQLKPYRLIHQLHQRHQQNSLKRAKQQKQDRYQESDSDSNLGLYVDRLIAAWIVELALVRKAATIAIPQLKGIRESVESDIRAQAERLFPNEKERQKEYAQDYRASFHRWSYDRLRECIKECAKTEGIAVVERKQSSLSDLQQKAIAIALSASNTKI